MFMNLRKLALTEEFDYNLLICALSKYKNPRVKINDLLKKGKIIRVKKGLYVFGPDLSRQPYSKETLANLIYGPSYISLEYALSFYGLIPERVKTVTSVTNKRKKLFTTPLGVFSYRHINPAVFSYGTTLYKIDNFHTILIATKEKALSDLIYFSNKIIDENQMREYLFEDLRIEKKDLKNFSLNKIKKLAQLYGQNVKFFYKLLKGIK
ncbi:hypothetical protein KAI68_08175 [bacterium]|nr:hypothetical protein [bacterium]